MNIDPAGRRFTARRRAGVASLLMTTMLAAALSGCAHENKDPNTVDTTESVQNPLDAQYYPSDQPYRMGVEHFNRGQFGLAERYFRAAVEAAPKDVSAWIGLAASYDRIPRFDLADRAYGKAIALGGETPQILNNRGYSYMLRGNLVSARAQFIKSNEREPNNPYVINNLRLLDGSARYINRPADAALCGPPTCPR